MHKKSRKKALLQIIGLVLAVVFAISIFYLAIDFWEKSRGGYSGEDWAVSGDVLDFNDQEYVLKNNVESLLLIGLDSLGGANEAESYNNDRLADFLLLLVMDHDHKTLSALQIDRDTMAQMNILGVAGEKIDTVEKQIAYAHTYGNGKEVSCRNVSNAVSKLLGGVNIKHYASVTMDAVSVMADLVDGVSVTLQSDYSDGDASYKKGDLLLLKGEDALSFVRARADQGVQTNEARMERQRLFLGSLHKEVMLSAETNADFIENAALKLSKYLVSDCSSNQLEAIMNKASSYEYLGIKTIEGEAVIADGYMEFYPDEAAMKQAVVDLFYQIKE